MRKKIKWKEWERGRGNGHFVPALNCAHIFVEGVHFLPYLEIKKSWPPLPSFFFFLCSYPSPSSPHLSFQKACPEGRRSLRREERGWASLVVMPPLLYSPKTHNQGRVFWEEHPPLSPVSMSFGLSRAQECRPSAPWDFPPFWLGGWCFPKKTKTKTKLKKKRRENWLSPPLPPPLPYNRLNGFFAATVSPSTRGVSRGVH